MSESKLILDAIDKIDKEAEKINNAYITSKVVQRIIEEKLTNLENANKILDSKKTLQGCIMYIYKNAQKQGQTKVSGAGVFVGGEDEDLWRWVCEYYGFKNDNLQSNAKSKRINLFDAL